MDMAASLFSIRGTPVNSLDYSLVRYALPITFVALVVMIIVWRLQRLEWEQACEALKQATELRRRLEFERNQAQEEVYRRLYEDSELDKEKFQFQAQLAEYEKYSTLAQLALGAAHGINNPLLGILSHLELELKSTSDHEQRWEIEQCIAGTKRISATLRGLVNYARPGPLLGAFDYLVKPFHLEDMTNILHRAAEVLALRVRVRDSVESEKGRYDFGHIVTHNPATIKMLEVARKAAEADHTTILILGESGTGKGVLAKAVHYASPRTSMPLLELNCAALPDALLESELFGYEPGAISRTRAQIRSRTQAVRGKAAPRDEDATWCHPRAPPAPGAFDPDLC